MKFQTSAILNSNKLLSELLQDCMNEKKSRYPRLKELLVYYVKMFKILGFIPQKSS